MIKKAMSPHGGTLINRVLYGPEREEALKQAQTLKSGCGDRGDAGGPGR